MQSSLFLCYLVSPGHLFLELLSPYRQKNQFAGLLQALRVPEG